MWLAVVSAALAGCPSADAPPACVTVDTACSPLYAPTFDNVYNNTLKAGCGSQLSSCHAANGAGVLALPDPAVAHGELLDGRVVPGDPGCSELVVRTGAPGKDYQMPPGSGASLTAAERCSLILWIEAGAPGPVNSAAPGGGR